MARRALPKIDVALDMSWHHLELEQVAAPVGSLQLFDRDAPLEIEIGSGKGLFVSAAATENPAHNFLGIEIAGKYARYAASRLTKRSLANARMVHGDAQRLMAMVPDASLAAVHVYFPDPWWKARHRKRRVMNEAMVTQIERTLIPGGMLHFWTDVEAYFLATLELLTSHPKLAGPHPVEEKPADHDLDYRTHFERRMRMHGKPVHRAQWTRVSG